MRNSVGIAMVSVLAAGCFYSRGNLETGKSRYANYPASVEEEQARRAKRRKHALIAAPIEIVGGVGLAALALYAKSSPPDDGDDSVTDNLGDAGKEVLGRLFLAALGAGVAVSGVGDGVLGLSDLAVDSPLVRDGELVAADRIDVVAPQPTPRLTLHSTSILTTQGIGGDAGFGIAHWLGPRVRMREALSGELTMPWGGGDSRYALALDIAVERAFGREHAGLYPKLAIGVYGGGAWTAIAGVDRAVVRGGLLFTSSRMHVQIRLGSSYVVGVDRHPSVDLAYRAELKVD